MITSSLSYVISIQLIVEKEILPDTDIVNIKQYLEASRRKMSNQRKIGIIGSGLIGQSWAMIFASAGYNVHIYDIDEKQIKKALSDIDQQFQYLEKEGVLKGKLSAKQQFECIKGTTKLEEAVKDTILIQECVPENLEIKRKLWKSVDDIVSPNTILSSSSSSLLPSSFSDHLKNKRNFVVSHPVNPPYYVPLVELVPAPWTDPEVMKKTRQIMEEIGQAPVSFSKEIVGFGVNRIQTAILNEAWHLVNDGYLDVKDMDKVMSEGLGMRYAFLGMFETTHLNANGYVEYCEKLGGKWYDISKTFKPPPKFEGPKVQEISKQLESDVPLNKLQERRNWRDTCLLKLSQMKKELNKLKK